MDQEASIQVWKLEGQRLKKYTKDMEEREAWLKTHTLPITRFPLWWTSKLPKDAWEELKEAISACAVEVAIRERSSRLKTLQANLDGMLALIEARKAEYADDPAGAVRDAGERLSRQGCQPGCVEVRLGAGGEDQRDAEAGGDRGRAMERAAGLQWAPCPSHWPRRF